MNSRRMPTVMPIRMANTPIATKTTNVFTSYGSLEK